MSPIPLMKENRLSLFTRVLVCLLLGMMCIIALRNIISGRVVQPKGLFIVLAGFTLFAISKIKVIRNRKLISFGTKHMKESWANLYRIGYWLMAVGVLVVFLG